jgi:hypothetical protein
VIASSLLISLVLVLAIMLAATRPWASNDREWFEVSALLEALLLGGALLVLL